MNYDMWRSHGQIFLFVGCNFLIFLKVKILKKKPLKTYKKT